MNTENERDIKQHLEILRRQPARNPTLASKGRADFLAQAKSLAHELSTPATATRKQRHIHWIHAVQTFLTPSKKEQFPMTALATLFVIFSLILGGGATVAAAQDSLPDQALYPVKTWSEELRTSFTADEQARLDLALELTGRRAAEIQTMLSAGQALPEDLTASYQSQVQSSLMLAANQPETQATAALARVQTRLETQQQAFDNLMMPENAAAAAELQRNRDMLRDMLQLCETGIQDPDRLRQQLRDQDQQQIHATPARQQRQVTGTVVTGSGGNPWTTGTPTPGSGYGAPATAGSGSGSTSGSNPWTTGTPTPGSSYGPGGTPGTGGAGNGQPGATCTPGSGTGSDNGAGNGNQPHTTATTEPGNGSGSGSGNGGGNGPGGKP